MKWIYTTHARLRMRQRSIGVRQIEATIHAPDRAIQSFGARLVAQRALGSRRLEVIYRRMDDALVIITAYWVEEGA